MDILRDCHHPSLLPLLGFCLDKDGLCLVFPLMVGGSLQMRLDLRPKHIESLQRMGHFTSAPKPLTWRQKLTIVLQATEALVYLHTPTATKPLVLHRDIKPQVRLAHATSLPTRLLSTLSATRV